MEKPAKPLMVAREEFAQKLADLCNESELAPAIMRPLLERAVTQLCQLEQEQYNNEMASYRAALQEYAKEQENEQES